MYNILPFVWNDRKTILVVASDSGTSIISFNLLANPVCSQIPTLHIACLCHIQRMLQGGSPSPKTTFVSKAALQQVHRLRRNGSRARFHIRNNVLLPQNYCMA